MPLRSCTHPRLHCFFIFRICGSSLIIFSTKCARLQFLIVGFALCGIPQHSVVGQCLFYHRGDLAPNPAGPRIEPTPEGVDQLARHITDFSLGGIARRRRQ